MTPKQLSAIRSRMGLTQAQFAECLRVSRNSIARMEKGGQVITPAMELLIGFVAREAVVEAAHGQRGGGSVGDKAAHRGKARHSDRKSGGRSRS